MAQHLEEMRNYITLSSSDMYRNSDDALSDITVLDESYAITPLMEELNDIVFKLESYRGGQSNPERAYGVEEGLAMAADMVRRIIERHSSK